MIYFGGVELSVTFATLSEKKKIKPTPYESVKIKKVVVDMLRDNRAKTGVSISFFIESLVTKELNKPK